MSYEEKSIWVFGVVALITYGGYVAVVLGRADGGRLADVAYVAPMLWSIGGAVVAGILGRIVTASMWPADADQRDDRDVELARAGERVGQSLVVLGGIIALVLAMVEVDHFWIANVLYLGFILSAVLSTVTQVIGYRRGLPRW